MPERTDRFVTEANDEWARSDFERDRDRILYTRELRRLKDVTQVARSGESYLYHDRLSHSLKVAQVGEGLARLISERPQNESIDVDSILDLHVVESACLAHDLGHPPFGHLSEEALDEKIREKTDPEKENEKGRNELEEWLEEEDDSEVDELPIYGYEGNAQSFRIVTRLASHYKTAAGLNLTCATLNAILKYPHSREKNDDKWGYYQTEKDRFEWVREDVSEGKTLEAELMDYADDVTYAIHDVADFYKGGLIPLDHLLGEAKRREETRTRLRQGRKEAIAKERDINPSDVEEEIEIEEEDLPGKPMLSEFEAHIERSDKRSLQETDVESFFYGLSHFPGVHDNLLTPFGGTDEESDTISRLVSNLVSRYLNASDEEDPEFVRLENREEENEYGLYIDLRYREQVWILKELTYYYVISDSTLVGQQRGERHVIEELYEALYEETGRDNLDSSAIPSPYRDWLEEEDEENQWPSPIHRRARIVADMIATMTEPQAVTLHKRLTGDTPGSLQNEIVR